MNFGKAIELLKKGKNVTREGWNGKHMCLFLAYGEDLSKCLFEKNEPLCHDAICMKTAQGTIVVGWLASQTDMLSEDWKEVEEPWYKQNSLISPCECIKSQKT